MGNRESSASSSAAPLLSFDDAKNLLSNDELKRLETAWDGRESISCEEFFEEVLCHPAIPQSTRSLIYSKFSQGASRLSFQNFVVAIVLLTKASRETRSEFLNGEPEIERWIDSPPQLTSRLSEIHYNFYQVLAGVTHLDEQEVEELEKVFGAINDTKLCKLTRNGFTQLVGGAIEAYFIDGLFRAFDENGDGLIDFKELVCGLSASCRGPDTARLNFAAQLFDEDSDGFLTRSDIETLYNHLNVETEAQTIRTDANGRASLTDFACWANETSCVNRLIETVQQIGHICLGLRPNNAEVELTIVSGFKERIGLESFAEWNVVSAEWWREWVYALMSRSKVPPINNSAIVASKAKNDWASKVPSLSGEGAPLRPGLQEGKDFEVLAPCLWRSLLRWHGSAAREGVSLPRRVVPSSYVDPSSRTPSVPTVELYPLTLLILRHSTASGGWLQSAFEWNASVKSSMRQSSWCSVCMSRSSTVGEVLSLLINQLRISDMESARLWAVEIDGKKTRKLLDKDSLTLHDLKIVSFAQLLLELRNADMSWPEEVSRLEISGGDSESSEGEDLPSGKGVTGIYNMGNTCYMNSAIQCLSNTKPLTEYFIEGRHKQDMKKLSSTKGTVALEYGSVVAELWSGKKRNIAPIKLRDAISANAGGVFAERTQHDCQEFLSILLDLLHEDLNRVINKPYVELTDSNGRPDVVVAKEAWDAHMRREQSIIVDLFTGQLRSLLTCTVCESMSSRFDAFTCLQLPIPIDHLLLIPVVVVKRDGHVPTRYGLRLDGNTKIGHFKNELGKHCSLRPNSFRILCLNRTGQLMRNVSKSVEDDATPISVYPNDALFYAFELPPSDDMEENGEVSGCSPTSNVKESSAHGDVSVHCCHAVSSEVLCSSTPKDNSEVLKNCEGTVNSTTASFAGSESTTADSSTLLPPSNYFIAAPTVIASHRKMQYNDTYLLGAARGCTVCLFGVPLVIRFSPGKTTGVELYEEVWLQVSRFLQNGPSDRSQRTRGTNRAIDAGEDIRSGYPFDLCMVDASFEWCSRCSWACFCRGCVLPRTGDVINESLVAVAVDWKPTALYLRYQHSVELLCCDDESVLRAWEVHYRACSLISCLSDFTRSELLDEPIYCKKCNLKTPTKKSLSIWRLPRILIIHFKRFVYVDAERRWMKSSKVVDFPLWDLDLSEWVLDQDAFDGAKYNCFAIANHYGAMASGHYVAYARNRDQWYAFNDSRCQAVKESQIDKKNAYLLFYERADA
uniref:ubiquitinyl hydrolase 1 n=1 Tax=Parascaris univalens TaxID=6257 RepID=A0A915CDK1_PARUN